MNPKPNVAGRRGASLAAALLLFLFCALAFMIVMIHTNAAIRRAALVREYEEQYASASSAARLIRDSLTDTDSINVLMMILLQYTNGEGAVLTITFSANDLPPAVCHVLYDSDLNFEVTVETDQFTLLMRLPAEVPGEIGWRREDVLIECLEIREG